MTHAYVAAVVAPEVDEVDGGTNPEVEAWHPHQHGVLETGGEVWIRRMPRTVPVLMGEGEKGREDKATDTLFYQPAQVTEKQTTKTQ